MAFEFVLPGMPINYTEPDVKKGLFNAMELVGSVSFVKTSITSNCLTSIMGIVKKWEQGGA
jgi:hypothetical protein